MTLPQSREAIYEELRERISATAPAADANSRDVEWTSASMSLGFARASSGGLELFLVGEPLKPFRPNVRRRLQHQEWATTEGVAVRANRLLLPDEPHFDRVAAFICAELLLNGVDDSLTTAFARSEEIIELALEGGVVSAEALLGLCGEMLFLESLTRADPGAARQLLMHAWAGHRPSTRDLQLGSVGVEVKTTTRGLSEHHIQGPHQVELGIPEGGGQETDLFLLSIGLRWCRFGDDEGFTVPALVSSLLEALPQQDRAEFRGRVSSYGGGSSWRYEHDRLETASEFLRPFTVDFVRMYDMTDPRIKLPRSDALAGMDLVPESVNYRIRLPVQVSGSLNPIVGMADVVEQLLGH